MWWPYAGRDLTRESNKGRAYVVFTARTVTSLWAWAGVSDTGFYCGGCLSILLVIVFKV